jgi:hypothetical protein
MESAGPRNVERQPGVPLFSYSANGITLDQWNGSFGYTGSLIRKGFNPDNPHHGDAIIATFFWLGSTNIIDSVTDVLTDVDFTPVGNTYHLVEYVTAGGVSMATYVATNIQNFPDPATGGVVLAVQANLRESVVDGGVQLSAWSGVEDVDSLALGAHQSATASGSGTVVVAPGPIAVNANALVFGVSMVPTSGLAGREPPTGFTELAVQSDASMVEDGEYIAPAGAGSTDPQWTYTFSSPSSALATVLTLNVAPPPPPPPPPLSVIITGKFNVKPNVSCVWNAAVSGGDGNYTFAWRKNGSLVGTTQTIELNTGVSSFTLRVDVQSGDGQSANNTKSVTVSTAGQTCVT